MNRERYSWIMAGLLIGLLIGLTAFTWLKPKILIIGDSISIGYTPFVKESLAEVADVIHNPGNAEHTGTGLARIKDWIGTEKWDIIQFNWGLWDLCYRNPKPESPANRDKINGKITFSVEDYSANLDSLVRTLKQLSDAKLIFVTTTFVPENEDGRFQDDPERYNDAAKKIMKKYSVTVNDIYEQSARIHHKYAKGPGDVHFTSEGYQELGKLIAGFLNKQIQ